MSFHIFIFLVLQVLCIHLVFLIFKIILIWEVSFVNDGTKGLNNVGMTCRKGGFIANV
jgi:hypothetical protein